MNLDAITRLISPKQIRSVVESAQARISIWSGAVRSGKTIASLIAFLIALAVAPSSGLIVICGRTLQTIERNIIDPLQDTAIFGPIALQVHHTRGANTASILGRTVHLIGASDARAEGRLRGLTACLAYVDEATLVPEAFFNQLLARLSVPAARLLATTNPDGPAHWLRKTFILRAGVLNLASWHFTLDDNPSLDPAYVAALKAEYVGLWFRRFILGEWCLAEGAIYDMFDPDIHVVHQLPPVQRIVGVGIDYGTRNPFAALRLALTPLGRLVLTSEYRHDPKITRRQLTDADYSREIRQWLGSEPSGWMCVDPSAASFKVQLHRDGVTSVTDADNSVADGLRLVASLLATDRLLIHESCTGLLDELPGYSWDDKAAAKGQDTPIKVDDHSLDAMRYAIATTRPVWQSHVPLAA